jgi:hypothetical protein
MFGKNLFGGKDAIATKLTLCDNAFAFFKKIWQKSLVLNLNIMGRIRHNKRHFEATRVTLNTSFLNKPANAKGFIFWSFICHHLGGAKKENQITLKSLQD